MTKILLVDDHTILLDSLKLLLSREADFETIGGARTGQEAIDMIQFEAWDVVVLDLALPDRSGIEVLRSIQQFTAPPPVLVLTMHDEKQFGPRLLHMGAAGFLTKWSKAQELLAAIRRVAHGQLYIPDTLADYLVRRQITAADQPLHARLSDRELQVFCLLAEGKAVSEVAEQLNVSRTTISTHRSHILNKMEMASTADLVQYAIWHRLIPWSPDAQLCEEHMG